MGVAAASVTRWSLEWATPALVGRACQHYWLGRAEGNDPAVGWASGPGASSGTRQRTHAEFWRPDGTPVELGAGDNGRAAALNNTGSVGIERDRTSLAWRHGRLIMLRGSANAGSVERDAVVAGPADRGAGVDKPAGCCATFAVSM
ncbi:hypothetical protein [Dactylosporangium aurantiacum]|uniref:hypothetical protein n=1 Tax=Dactylosporangium aurantiacum TaxID=35754 RepID=UPI0024355C34|nr:hypothetical protein [Dactylosporangium aurantiacum]